MVRSRQSPRRARATKRCLAYADRKVPLLKEQRGRVRECPWASGRQFVGGEVWVQNRGFTTADAGSVTQAVGGGGGLS